MSLKGVFWISTWEQGKGFWGRLVPIGVVTRDNVGGKVIPWRPGMTRGCRAKRFEKRPAVRQMQGFFGNPGVSPISQGSRGTSRSLFLDFNGATRYEEAEERGRRAKKMTSCECGCGEGQILANGSVSQVK